MQMMLMLVLGHVLALTKPVDRAIQFFTTRYCNSTASAALMVTLLTVTVALFNWGLGLIFGAIFARKVAEHASRHLLELNYPIIGAAGYSGLMVWHGGFSGSSLAKIAEPAHIQSMMTGAMSEDQLAQLPNSIGYGETVFGPMNLTISIALLILLPLSMYWLGKKSKSKKFTLPRNAFEHEVDQHTPTGAESLDYAKWLGIIVGAFILVVAGYKALAHPETSAFKFITPNWINLTLLGMGLLLHARFSSFLKGVESAIGGSAGILIQFPLYFGIMGIMKGSGLVQVISEQFVSFCATSDSPETLYPILTFFSAGFVNIFVPSGGGQWAVQGPIIVQAASDMNLPLVKSIMAMAYGDQLTNMLQPFWALPLLGITGLKAKDILPYTLFLFLVGTVIFVLGLLVF